MIVWPSDGKAAEANQTKIIPVIKRIPGLREEMMRPRAFRSDRYAFTNCVSYFQGSGTKVMSKSCQLVLGDEVDQFQPPPNVNQIKEMEKRTRSYDHSIVGLVCTPTTENGAIWQQYLGGSQGKWFLRCKGCGNLTIDSGDTNCLQFNSDYDEERRTYKVRKGTPRLVCPVCGYQHVESDRRWMNINGDWKHKFPDLLDTYPTFQFGALASQLRSLSWDYIAQQQLDAGKTSDIELQMSFDNSIRGRAWKPRKISKDEIETLRQRHCWTMPPSLENVEMIFITVDTMDDFFSYAVFAWDVTDSLYMLENGETEYMDLSDEKRAQVNEELKAAGKPPAVTLADIYEKDYLVKDGVGIRPTFIVIDQGGHRGEEVKYFAKMHRRVYMQKGTSMTALNWKLSDNQQRLIITNEKYFKSTAIYYLYSQKNRQENFLFFNPSISEETLAEIRDVVPDNSSKWGDQPRKLDLKDRQRSCF